MPQTTQASFHPSSPWLTEAQALFEKEYEKFSKNLNSDLNTNFLDHDLSQPFELFPSTQEPPKNTPIRKAMILIHGFLGVPYFMKSLATLFSKQGFYCYAPRLPGHGICPEALRCQNLEKILEILSAEIKSMEDQFDEIHLCGFSLGGLLSVLLANGLNHFDHQKIKSLILFAPAFGISPLAKLIPTLNFLGLGNLRNTSAANMNGLRNPVMYANYPLCSVLPIIHGIKNLKQKSEQAHKNNQAIPSTQLPIFMIGSFDDAVVKFSPLINFINQNKNPQSCIYLYAGKAHWPAIQAEIQAQVLNQNLFFIDPSETNKNILNLSHVSLLIPPEDPLFGQNSPQYKNLPENFYLGEKIPGVNFRKNLYRLFYNPDFPALSAALLKFLNFLN